MATDVVLRLAAGTMAPLERRAIERRMDECDLCRRFVADVMRQSEARGSGSSETVAERPARVQARSAPADAPRLGLPLPGQRIDRYLIERPLGAGGMGMVSLALDEDLKRRIVIKLVRPDLVSAQATSAAPSGLDARLMREAQALARLSHPNVVSIFDIGRFGAQIFFAMEYVAGVDLATYLAAARRTPEDILTKFLAAGAGLCAAHRAGVVHRDFKPANVLVGDDGAVKVADFGLARGVAAGVTLSEGGAGAAARRSSLLDAVLTGVDRTVGTPAYMAPEQITGEGVDARSDQFAFSVALIDALLHQDPSARRVRPQSATDEELRALGPALVGAGLGASQAAALVRALQADPAQRWPSMDALLAVLGSEAEPALAPPEPPMPPPETMPHTAAPPVAGRRRRRAAVVGGVLVGAAALVALGVALRQEASVGDCDERERLEALVAPARLVELTARGIGPSLFDEWTARAQAGRIAERVRAVARAHDHRCRGRALPAGCTPTSSTDASAALGAANGLAALITAEASLVTCDAAAPLAAPASPQAVRTLEAARAALVTGDLDEARRAATEAAQRLASTPVLGASAYAVAARAALLSGHGDATDLLAKAAAEAERAGDDGQRANALVLELTRAQLFNEADRAARAQGMLASLVERRGAQPKDRALALACAAATAEVFGAPAESALRWGETLALAREAGDLALVERARVGEIVADLATRSFARRARGEPREPRLGALADHLAIARWSGAATTAADLAALDAALAYQLEVPAETLRAAPARLERAATLAGFGDLALSPLLRGRARAQALALEGALDAASLDAEVERARDAHRLIEGAALALAMARSTALPPRDAQRAVSKARSALFMGKWGDDGARPPAALALEAQLIERDLAAAGAIARDDLLISRSAFAGLPAPSLLRAEAAWQLAEHSRATSRYLQGEEDLELAIPRWRELGADARAASAAWWIAQESPYPRARARAHAQLARDLFATSGNHAEVADIDRWLAAHPAEAP